MAKSKQEVWKTWYENKKAGKGKWARRHDKCKECGETKRPHFGKGLCSRCYGDQKVYKRSCGRCSKAYKTSRHTSRFCSRSCAARHNGKASKSHETPAHLERACEEAIRKEGRYVNRLELSRLVKVRNNDFEKYGVHPPSINVRLGFYPARGNGRSTSHLHFEELLKKQFPLLESEKCFSEIRSPSGRYLSFDYFIPELDVIVELDGSEHSSWVKKKIDEYKTIAVEKLGYPVIRVRIPVVKNAEGWQETLLDFEDQLGFLGRSHEPLESPM